MGAFLRHDKAEIAVDLEKIYGYFPRLKERAAQLGATGNVSGSHLHLEIQLRGAPTDPYGFLFAANPGSTALMSHAELVAYVCELGLDAEMAAYLLGSEKCPVLKETAALPLLGSEASPSGSGSPVRVSAQTRARACAPASVRGWRPTHPRSRARDRLRVPPGTRRMLQDAMDEVDDVNGPSRPPPGASADGGDAAPGAPQVRNPLHPLRRAAPCGTHNGSKGRCDIAERQWKPGACVCANTCACVCACVRARCGRAMNRAHVCPRLI